MAKKQAIQVTVNGRVREAMVEPRLLLVHFIRSFAGLTGTHVGCDTTHCGACTVMLDGKTVKSCTLFAVQADGCELLTVEGLMQNGKLHPLQEGFKEEHGLQCGYCTPGMLMSSYALLNKESQSYRRRDPLGDLREPMPLYWLPEHRQSGAVCRRQDGPEGSKDESAEHRLRSVAWAIPSSARKIFASFRAKATMWTTLTPRYGLRPHRTQPLRPCAPEERQHKNAMELPGVLAVITGEDLAKANLAWMPTLFFDKQMVLATGKVLFQSQEVAFVVAEDPYIAADAAELVEVDYEELPVLVDPHKALDPTAPILREDREQKDNHIFHWEVGDRPPRTRCLPTQRSRPGARHLPALPSVAP